MSSLCICAKKKTAFKPAFLVLQCLHLRVIKLHSGWRELESHVLMSETYPRSPFACQITRGDILKSAYQMKIDRPTPSHVYDCQEWKNARHMNIFHATPWQSNNGRSLKDLVDDRYNGLYVPVYIGREVITTVYSGWDLEVVYSARSNDDSKQWISLKLGDSVLIRTMDTDLHLTDRIVTYCNYERAY